MWAKDLADDAVDVIDALNAEFCANPQAPEALKHYKRVMLTPSVRPEDVEACRQWMALDSRNVLAWALVAHLIKRAVSTDESSGAA